MGKNFRFRDLELAALKTVSIKEEYASKGSSENLEGMRASTKEKNRNQSALLKFNLSSC